MDKLENKEKNVCKVALCSIIRNENKYLKEFVDYYINLGVDKIFIYDNNLANGERVSEVIDEVNYPQVEIIDYTGYELRQLRAYQDCYTKHNEEFDWIMFLDCDEFLTLVHDKTIQDYVSRDIFNGFDSILVNWMCYGSNGIDYVENENYSVLSRFKEPVQPIDFVERYGASQNNHVKSIVRGKRKFIWDNAHTPTRGLVCCNNKGEKCKEVKPLIPFNYDEAYIKHFYTKSTEEYLNKVIRGCTSHLVKLEEFNDRLYRYFFYSPRTEEAEKVLGFDNDSADIFICTHKDFSIAPINKIYTILHGDEKVNIPLKQISEGKTGDTLNSLQHAYGECSRIYWIWKNYKLKDYVGFCHYRRYFEFYNKVPSIKAAIGRWGAIVPKPVYLNATIAQHYATYHSKHDLDLVCNIIKSDFNDQYDDFIRFINGNMMYCGNMFIMKFDMFNKYCEFVFGIMKKFDEIRGFKTSDDVLKYVQEHKELYYQGYGDDYQARLQGFLCERLTSFFIMQNFPYSYKSDIIEVGSNEKSKESCVTIPVYKETLSDFEKHSLIECVKKLGIKYEIHLVCPQDLNIEGYMKYHTFKVDRFDNEYFKSVKDYHRLLKSSAFYDRYMDFNYIFHYQLDSWVNGSELECFTQIGLDYYGALHKINGSDEYYGGDGGVSLRKVSTFKRLTEELEREGKVDNDIKEDELFTRLGIEGKLRMTYTNLSKYFSINDNPKEIVLETMAIPFACRHIMETKDGYEVWFRYTYY